MNSYPIIAQTPTVATPGIQQETPAERILRLNGLQGDPRESLKSLEENAAKRENWRDGVNKIFGTDPKSNPDAINWAQRDFDGDGRVEVTKFDALIGRSQPELQAAWERFRRNELKKEYGGRYLAEKGRILKPDERSNAQTVQQELQAEEARKKNTEEPFGEVTSMDGYRVGMLPDRPTLEQINILKAKLLPLQQSTIDAGRQLNSQLETEDSNRQTAQSMRDLNVLQGEVLQQGAQTERDRLTLEGQIANINRVIAENNQASSDYNAAEDRRLREQQNQMTMQLAIMKQNDNKADRVERRDDRRYENRQAAIIALIQGLARLGQGFQL